MVISQQMASVRQLCSGVAERIVELGAPAVPHALLEGGGRQRVKALIASVSVL